MGKLKYVDCVQAVFGVCSSESQKLQNVFVQWMGVHFWFTYMEVLQSIYLEDIFLFSFLKKEKHGGSMCSGTYGGGRKGLGRWMAWLLLYSLQCHWILVWIERTLAIIDSIIRGPWKWYWIFIPLVMKGKNIPTLLLIFKIYYEEIMHTCNKIIYIMICYRLLKTPPAVTIVN